MTNFDMKQWLQENRIGPYNGLLKENLGDAQAQADHEMEEEDDENGGMVNNVSMGTVAEARGSKTFLVDLEEEPFFILGKEYIISGEVDVEGSSDEEGFTFDHAAITIKEIHEENGNEYTEVKDPVKIKMIQDLINTDKKLQYDLEDAVANKGDFGDYEDDSDWSGSEVDEQIGIGYASITKPSDPNHRPPLEI